MIKTFVTAMCTKAARSPLREPALIMIKTFVTAMYTEAVSKGRLSDIALIMIKTFVTAMYTEPSSSSSSLSTLRWSLSSVPLLSSER